MGRYYWDKKSEADYARSVDAAWLKKHGYFKGWKSGTITWTGPSGHKSSVGITIDTEVRALRFYYMQTDGVTGEKQEFDYKVQLTSTACNLGGVRWWFICPLIKNGIKCGRRVRVLYKEGSYFGCRHCHNLTYSSQNISKGRFYALAKALNAEQKAEELYMSLRQHSYRGRPTKRYKRFMRLNEQAHSASLKMLDWL